MQCKHVDLDFGVLQLVVSLSSLPVVASLRRQKLTRSASRIFLTSPTPQRCTPQPQADFKELLGNP
jgi:hypothetical protein